MNNIPQISVILPVYNRRALIKRAIASVFAQTCRDWELLILDDGSTDGVEDDLLPMVLDNPALRYHKHARRGVAATRNLGILAAAGSYITFIDSDDEYKPEHLALRLRYMREHPEVDLVHGGVELVGPPDSHYVRDAFHPDQKIHISDCYIGATLFGKKEVFINSGGFKLLPYSAESEFVPRIMEHYKVARVYDTTYIYYTGLEDSICTLQKKEKPGS